MYQKSTLGNLLQKKKEHKWLWSPYHQPDIISITGLFINVKWATIHLLELCSEYYFRGERI